VPEVLAGDELHDEELSLALEEVVDDVRKRGVLERVEQPGLALEGLAKRLARDERLFERDRAAEALVRRQIDGAHTALPELAHDQISVLKERVRFEHSVTIPQERGQESGVRSQGRQKRRQPFYVFPDS
jgi:hypothetical protein